MPRLKHILMLFNFALVLLTISSVHAKSTNLETYKSQKLIEAQTAFNRGNHDKALLVWRELAKTGHTGAQVLVGLAYMNAWGVKRNEAMAEKWYLRAAKANNTSAQFLLGLLYVSRSDHKQAQQGVIWLQRAASLGDLDASQFLEKARKNNWLDHITPQRVSATTAPVY